MKRAFETGPLSKAEELETLLGWLGLEYSLPMQPQFKQEGLGIAGMLLSTGRTAWCARVSWTSR